MCGTCSFKEKFCISEIVCISWNETVVMATTLKSKYLTEKCVPHSHRKMKTETGRMDKQKQYEMAKPFLIFRHAEKQN